MNAVDMNALLYSLRDEQSAWTEWQDLEGCGRGKQVPTVPGLYRLQLVTPQIQEVVYIGQSERLRTRMSMLGGIFAEVMPYRSPHVAGPPLWAVRHDLLRRGVREVRFEVSFVLLEHASKPERLGLECVALALYRQRYQRSPCANYGRIIPGYRASSFNTAKLVEQGKRYRGGPTSETQESHLPGVPPMGSLCGDPQDHDWCGHRWSEWFPIADAPAREARGFYRLRDSRKHSLLYLGHGVIRDRIKPYVAHGQVEYSWAPGHWLAHQYLELTDDLIAAHVFAHAAVPLWQFEQRGGGPGDEPQVDVRTTQGDDRENHQSDARFPHDIGRASGACTSTRGAGKEKYYANYAA